MSSVIGTRTNGTTPAALRGQAAAPVRGRTLAPDSTLGTDGSTLLLICP